MTTVSTELHSSAAFALELEGVQTATVRSVEGGTIKTEIISYHPNGKGVFRQNGKLKYEPIKVQANLACGPDLWAWMDSFVRGTCTRKHGAIIAADFDYKEKARRTFKEALIEELAFPSFNSNDKNPANVTLTIQPETLVYEKPGGSGSVVRGDGSIGKLQHAKTCNFNFIFDLAGQEPIKRVTKIDQFSIKSKSIDYHHAGRLDPIKIPGKLEYPNITFYLPEADAGYFLDLQRKVVGGDRPPAANAVIEYLDSEKKKVGEIKFEGCHVFSAAPDKLDAGTEEMRQVKVEMSIEGMTLTRA